MSTPQPTSGTKHDVNTLPDQFHARIVGEVKHRVGDGPLELIPVGEEVEVNMAIASMVLSWMSEGQPVTVTLAREEFMEYVDTGAIQIHT